MRTIGIIPVRYESTRFPGKPLIDIAGKTMVQRVYEQASKATTLTDIVVATDDRRIFEMVESFGGKVVMTSSTHQSGTDRCAEVTNHHQDIDAIINIQGDEPFLDPSQIDLVANLLQKREVEIATLAKKIEGTTDLINPNNVKVVLQKDKQALYFSRSPIPYNRSLPQEQWVKKSTYFHHIGIYGFKRSTLLEIAQLSRTSLEKTEFLEQLRWMEHGFPIHVALTDKPSFGIDTPEDWEKAKLMAEQLKW